MLSPSQWIPCFKSMEIGESSSSPAIELVPIGSDDVIIDTPSDSDWSFVEDPFEGEFHDEDWVFVQDPFEDEFHDDDWVSVESHRYLTDTNGHHINRVWNISTPENIITVLGFVGAILFAVETASASDKVPGKLNRFLVLPILLCFAVVYLVYKELPVGSIKARKVMSAVLNALLIPCSHVCRTLSSLGSLEGKQLGFGY